MLFVSVLKRKISDGKEIIGQENTALNLIPLMLDILKKYKYRVDKKKSVSEGSGPTFTCSVTF